MGLTKRKRNGGGNQGEFWGRTLAAKGGERERE